jgi:hypothetical protein
MIIGVSGLAGAGKDTVADYLVSNHGFVKIALADPLKRICKDVFDFTDEQLWGPSEKRNEPDERYYRGTIVLRGRQVLEEEDQPPEECPQYLTPRHALQQLGTEWGRECYDNVWVDYALRVAKQILNDPLYNMYSQREGVVPQLEQTPQGEFQREDAPSGVIKGVVFSDIRFVNEINALREARAKLIRVKRPGYDRPLWNHPSETEQMSIKDEEFDVVLYNENTKSELADTIAIVLKSLS